MRVVCVFCFILISVLVLNSAELVHAVDAWVLYEDFSGTTIDAAKWIGDELYGHGGDANRILLSGTLRMRYAGYGGTTSNTSGVWSSLLLTFVNPSPITAVKATINAFNYGLQGCPGNSGFAARVRAQFAGSFFNAGTPAPGSETDNVRAYFRLLRRDSDAADTFRVEAEAVRCLDATCSTSTGFSYQMGTVPKGTPATMSVAWDKPNKKFIFQWGSTSVEYGYPWSDSAPPTSEFKRFHAQTAIPNCTVGPRPYGWITARFDDVYVNASALMARPRPVPAVRENPASRADWW